MTTIEKPRYRTPTHTESVTVSLNDFSDEQIAEYLQHQGYAVSGFPSNGGPIASGHLLIESADLDRLWTLGLCGQEAAAREWLVDLVSQHIGRDLSRGQAGKGGA